MAVVAGPPAALLAAGVDTGAFGDWLPLVRRQVDDAWLARYRSWVYGGGFGWQIGVGVATYIYDCGGVPDRPARCPDHQPRRGAGDLYRVQGLTSAGLAVLLTSRAGSPDRLRVLHRRLERVREPVRWTVIGAEAVVAVVAAAAAVGFGAGWPVGGLRVVVGAVAVLVATETRRRRARRRDLAWPSTS